MPRLCKGTWLNTYLDYTREQESPEAFHRWVGLAMISAAIGRNLRIDRTYYKIFPNLFVILVAGSGMCRKSSAIHIGTRILKALKQPPLMFSQKITAEALIQALQEGQQDGQMVGLIYADELSVFMGGDAVKSGLIPLLTNLYDGHDEWSYHTRGRGIEQLSNVCLTMIAASTMEWLKNSIPMDAIGGGFTGRIIFVHEASPSRPCLFPKKCEGFDTMFHNLVHDLEEIRGYKGDIIITPSASAMLEDWYVNRHFYEPRDPNVSGYFARKHDHVLKIATLMSVSEGSSLLVRDKHITETLTMLEQVEGKLEEVAATVSTSASSTPTEKVLQVIQRHRKISHTELLRKCWRFASAQEMQFVIQTLVDSKQIKETVGDKKGREYEAC